jgi:hypothetical protein
MARNTQILARNIREANHYAKVIGLQRFSYRAVQSAGQIRGTRNAEVHMLSSFWRNPARFTVLNALRWAKLDVYYVDFVDGKVLDGETEPEAEIEGPSERDLEVAYRYNRLLDAEETDGEEAGEAEQGEDAAPEAQGEAPKRRRTRCKDCGSLHYKDEACDPAESAADDNGFAPRAEPDDFVF